MKPVVIVDSGGANLASLQHALARLSVQAIISAEAAQIQQASHVILPGVGAAAMAMDRLRARGLIEVLRGLQQPLLGICLGMQLLFEHSAEGDTPCLGLLKGRVERLQGDAQHPVPHMGWNTLMTTDHPLLKDCDGQWFYFVHSYYVPETIPSGIATTRYQQTFTAAVGQGLVMGVQCHPERSAEAGRQLLRNFLDLPTPATC